MSESDSDAKKILSIGKKLLDILKYEAPGLGLIVHTWGFVSIREILKLKFKEFEGLTQADLMTCVEDYLKIDGVKKNTLSTRRDPDNPQEVQIRATKGHSFAVQTDTGFDYKTTENSRLSKTLSYFLRHHSPKYVRDPFGYVRLDWLLEQSNFRYYTLEQVVELIETAEGIDRFHLLMNKRNSDLEIRANYGHTFEVCSVELEQIHYPADFPTVIYGTNFECWEEIKKTGIPRTTLVHIHLASDEDHIKRCRFVYYSEYQLLDVLIYIDLEKALEDGVKFFITFNGVVLCRREKEGDQFLDPKYFLRAVNIATGEDMLLNQGGKNGISI